MNNSFDFTGFVGSDPEKRFMPTNGKPVITVSLGVDASYKDRNTNETVERTEWIDLVVYREGLAGVFDQYVRKGSEIRVRGVVHKETWESKDRTNEDGKPRMESRYRFIVSDLRLMRRPKDGASSTPTAPEDLAQANAAAAAASQEDQDIPF
ncbi:single-stranded DNA-binding protein [Castellaniella sp.]|uniref:single-stranded DNA-binding protein n=1 Tax=Castellaniella sp. TaxID=1955812 RepID=UPI002AFEA0F2|nr:single-stranded DNA-binding protein [Castellaniella sp.]